VFQASLQFNLYIHLPATAEHSGSFPLIALIFPQGNEVRRKFVGPAIVSVFNVCIANIAATLALASFARSLHCAQNFTPIYSIDLKFTCGYRRY
jgi:hypothetical protein